MPAPVRNWRGLLSEIRPNPTLGWTRHPIAAQNGACESRPPRLWLWRQGVRHEYDPQMVAAAMTALALSAAPIAADAAHGGMGGGGGGGMGGGGGWHGG